MDKKRLVLLITIFLASVSFAQGKLLEKSNHHLKQVRGNGKPSSKAKGPNGYGPLKLGMTKESVEALKPSDGVYLNALLTPHKDKSDTTKVGEEKFDTSIVTPLGTAPLDSTLTFQNGQLTDLYIKLDDASSMMERVKSQIAEKYGPGKVNDLRKEKQCIYKNGSNFKLTSGIVFTTWSTPLSAKERVLTSLMDASIDSCPDNLLDGSIGPIKLKSLSISRVSNTANAKPKNLF